jgi:hypothetical protein
MHRVQMLYAKGGLCKQYKSIYAIVNMNGLVELVSLSSSKFLVSAIARVGRASQYNFDGWCLQTSARRV